MREKTTKDQKVINRDHVWMYTFDMISADLCLERSTWKKKSIYQQKYRNLQKLKKLEKEGDQIWEQRERARLSALYLREKPVTPEKPEVLDLETPSDPVSVADMLPQVETIVSKATNGNIPTPVSSGNHSELFIGEIVENGLEAIKQQTMELQRSSARSLVQQNNDIVLLFAQLRSKFSTAKPSDLAAIIQAYEKLVKLHRNALMLPFGSLSPDTMLKKTDNRANTSLHLHNHGMQGYDPNKK